MKLKSNDKFAVNELKYNLGEYVVPEDTKFGIAVDIGCNNGCFIEKYKNHFSEIHAFEANIFLVEKLKKTFPENNIKINHNAAFNTDNQILKLLTNKYTIDNGSFSIEKPIEHNDWEEFVCEVESISLETILKNCNNYIDYAKIDCETSEYELLMNKNLNNIKYMCLELHCQLGKQKYTDLYNFICRTHTPNKSLKYNENGHQEILFSKLF